VWSASAFRLKAFDHPIERRGVQRKPFLSQAGGHWPVQRGSTTVILSDGPTARAKDLVSLPRHWQLKLDPSRKRAQDDEPGQDREIEVAAQRASSGIGATRKQELAPERRAALWPAHDRCATLA
jgi:hypothetical protein